MSNRFDDENNIEMDIKTAFASWGKYVFKCFPQECRLRSFLSEDSLDDSEEKNVDIINNPFIDSMVDRNNLLKAVEQIADGEKFATVVLHAKEGTDTYRISFKSICFDDAGRTVEAIGLAEQLDERLNESEMVNALGSNFNSIYYVDVDNNKMYPYRMNPSVRAMFGEVLESKPGYQEMMEQYVNAIVLEEDKLHMLLETSINNLRRQFLIKDTYQHDYRIVRDGQVQYCRAKFVNVSGVGELHKMIAGFSDISPEKQRELERIAYVDAVTGGNNYESFKKKLRDRNVSGYLISMDIHSFKIVNSICGVAKGDEALRWISENIRGVVGYNDISGHINADRFVIFFADDKINKVIRKIETINLQLIKVSESLKIPKIQPYFGVTKWEPGKKVEEAYGEANFAKNRIKERKDVLYQIYSQADTERIVEEKQMEDNFYRDLNDNHFEIWYQPKYAPKTNKLVGAEGLVRWRRENNEIIPPSKFIPLFERNGMIKALDEYVFREVCTHQRRWLDEGKKIVPISINLSRASLYFESVVKRYHDIARRIGIYTHLVPIEITESAAVDNDEIKSIADKFHGNGFPLLVDDFGSGYSSLVTLNMKCFDTLKIDKSLIDYIGDSNGERLLVHTIALAKELGICVTAEGDECLDDLNRVCEGIDNAVEDTSIVLALVSDDNVFFETKKEYGKDMVTGFIRLNGMTIGAVANRAKIYDEEGNAVQEFGGTLSVRGCKKAADFVNFCDAFNIPVVTLTNVTGFEASKCSEKSLAREAAKLTYAFANATVPKVNVVIGKAFGSAYVTMNSKSLGADMVYAWPTAEIGMMEADLAAKIMYADADAETINEKAKEYAELQSSPVSAARRGYVDTIIQPADTRKYVIGAFEMLFTKREESPMKKHGTV